MNRTFEPLRIVNTYGAFGSISKVREKSLPQDARYILPTRPAPWTSALAIRV